MMQIIPAKGTLRESLQQRGQFWTPQWLAEVMASWIISDNPKVIFDPAVGPGTFYAAAKKRGYTGQFHGYELYENAFDDCGLHGLARTELQGVQIADFIESDNGVHYSSIIANPPYLRHHKLSAETKAKLKKIAVKVLGFPLDGRVGLHVFFLLKCLDILKEGGRLAFLLPADVCEGVSSQNMWTEICRRYTVESVIRFNGTASPFPKVDTNALVFLLKKQKPHNEFRWIDVQRPNTETIISALSNYADETSLKVYKRTLSEALETGFSRPPVKVKEGGIKLGRLARVMRGIASGGNEFFFLTRKQIEEKNLPMEFFVRAIGRTRDCTDERLTHRHLDNLEMAGRPTWLLNITENHPEYSSFPVQKYLREGLDMLLHERALIKQRNPWHKMEQRKPPAFLFAYLGRRACRFILNEADVVPLTGFLCIYPKYESKVDVIRLWQALNDPETLDNLSLVGKSYGGGAIKVEPRQLDQLVLPLQVIERYGIKPPKTEPYSQQNLML
jgi:adenine-specific DNA-methyltransferase